jgi:opacity protein-like surface antigen
LTRTLRYAFALLLASTAAVAQAQTAGSENYLMARLGMYQPTSDDMDYFDFNSGLAGDVVFGRYVHPNIAMEFGLGYFKSAMDDTDGDVTMSVVPITMSARFLVPVGRAEPYGLIGVGVFRATYEEDSGFGSYDETANAFGLQLGGGVRFNISPNAFLGADLRYLVAEPEFDAGDGTDVGIEIDGLLLNAAFGFRF